MPPAPEDVQRKNAPEESSGEVRPKEVRRLASLARLQLPEEEVQKLTGELDRILSYARQLEEVDTAGIKPMSQPMALHAATTLRPDEARQRISRKKALGSAPTPDDGFFSVPLANRE